MGGMNQNRYGATANASHHPQSSNQQTGMGFASLPEYQYPAKRHNNSSSYNQQQQAAAPRQQMRPRQHIVPAAPQQHQYPQQQPMIDSPTLSATSQGESDHSGNQQQQFHYNPYDTQCSRVTYQQQQEAQHPHFPSQQQQDQYQAQSQYHNHHQPQQQSQHYEAQVSEDQQQQMPQDEAPPKSALPYGTLHGHLEAYVSFVPYPTEEFVNPNKGNHQVPSEGNMSRVFLGQLPYQVTDMQLDWLCYTFGMGGCVQFPERITKHDPMRGCKVPTGCIHAYCDNDLVTPMLNSMHKRILVDDTGVWFADGPEQQSVLNDYCLMMKNDRTKRYQNRPYDTVVAQFATSSFVRRR